VGYGSIVVALALRGGIFPLHGWVPRLFQNASYAGAMLFIALVIVGFAYDWRKGVFRWR
jgi:NADH:ubiquinone oxidoreductase subunit 4 (subunit M)